MNKPISNPCVLLEMNLDQVDAVRTALNLLNRVSLNQIEEIADLMRSEIIQGRADDNSAAVTIDAIEHANDLLAEINRLIGHPGAPAIGQRRL